MRSSSQGSASESFIQCLLNHSRPCHPISAAMYTPNNDSYFSILQAYIRNLRFNTTTTQKPFLIFTALHESHIQAAIACAQKQDLHVADKLDENLFTRLILDIVNGTNVEKTGRATFIALFLDCEQLLSIMNKSFPEFGLKKSDCKETSWVPSVLFWTNLDLGTPTEILLTRVPQTLSYLKLKRKSDYLKEPIPKDGLELIWKKLIELEYVALAFNPYGGRMSEIPAIKILTWVLITIMVRQVTKKEELMGSSIQW